MNLRNSEVISNFAARFDEFGVPSLGAEIIPTESDPGNSGVENKKLIIHNYEKNILDDCRSRERQLCVLAPTAPKADTAKVVRLQNVEVTATRATKTTPGGIHQR